MSVDVDRLAEFQSAAALLARDAETLRELSQVESAGVYVPRRAYDAIIEDIERSLTAAEAALIQYRPRERRLRQWWRRS